MNRALRDPSVHGTGAFRSAQDSLRDRDLLSNREREVLQCVARGLTDMETGQLLCISAKTVEKHVASARIKLDASTRMGAVLAAIRLNIIAWPEHDEIYEQEATRETLAVHRFAAHPRRPVRSPARPSSRLPHRSRT